MFLGQGQAWSRLQKLFQGPANPTVEQKRADDLVFWEFVDDMWAVQNELGRLVMTEQPKDAKSLLLLMMQRRPNLARALVAHCRFGVQDPMSGLPYQKWTAFDNNCQASADLLMDRANCICQFLTSRS